MVQDKLTYLEKSGADWCKIESISFIPFLLKNKNFFFSVENTVCFEVKPGSVYLKVLSFFQGYFPIFSLILILCFSFFFFLEFIAYFLDFTNLYFDFFLLLILFACLVFYIVCYCLQLFSKVFSWYK